MTKQNSDYHITRSSPGTAQRVGISQLKTRPPSLIHSLAVLAIHLPPPPRTKLDDPHNNGDEHQRRRSPGKRQKLAAPVRLNTNLLPMLIDDLDALDDHSRDKRTSKPNRQKRNQRERKINTRRQPPLRKNGNGRGAERKEHGRNGDAVQHKRGSHEDIDGLDARLDVVRPLEVVEGDGDARLVEGLLQDGRGVEAVHCAVLAALCDVLVDGARRDRGVGDIRRCVAAAAVVEQVRRVPVVDAEFVGYVADG
jgi:hypothetical protein